MKSDTTQLRRERVLLRLLGVICLTLLAGALYFQYVKGQGPCPLCILQRYAYVLIAIAVFLGAQMSSWRGVRLFEGFVVLSTLGGTMSAIRLVWVQAFPDFSCGFDTLRAIVDSLPPAHWLPGVFGVQGAMRDDLSTDPRTQDADLGLPYVRVRACRCRSQPVAQPSAQDALRQPLMARKPFDKQTALWLRVGIEHADTVWIS